MMNRTSAFVYGIACYFVFFGAFLYLAGFLSDLAVPKSINSGTAGSSGVALTVNTLLIVLFGVQHSVMARPGFKRQWTRIIPEPVERSTFVLLASFALIALFIFWQPMPKVIWNIESSAARFFSHALFFSGLLLVVYSTFLINHFDLFGLRQTYLFFVQKPYAPTPFKVNSLYRHLRHPMMLGFLIAFWATPTMTHGRLLFSAGFTALIFIGIAFEERDTAKFFGEAYKRYRMETSMVFPKPKRGKQG